MRINQKRNLVALAVVGLVVLAGCGGGNEEPAAKSTEEASADAQEAPAEETKAAGPVAPQTAEVAWMDKLPASYKESGVVKAATTDGMPPWVFIDTATNTAAGVDAELINEAAKRLGLTVEWQDVQFSAALPGVEGHRFDLYVSAMADRIDRQEVANFIDYSSEGSGIVVAKGNPKGIKTFEDLCGTKVVYMTGSMFPPLVEELNAGPCKDNNIQASEAAEKSANYLAVASGQADATFDTYGVSNYLFSTSTEGVNLEVDLVTDLPPFAPAHQGIAFAQDNVDFMYAMAGAMQQMVEDGSYQKIYDKWAVGSLAMKNIMVNTVIEAGLTEFLEQ